MGIRRGGRAGLVNCAASGRRMAPLSFFIALERVCRKGPAWESSTGAMVTGHMMQSRHGDTGMLPEGNRVTVHRMSEDVTCFSTCGTETAHREP